MTLFRLVLRTALFHWRGNLAVLLGVIVGATVLTGALLVGDALRASLRRLAQERLGWVDQVLVSGRMLREQVATTLKAEAVAPALVMRCTSRTNASPRTTRQVMLLGVEERFWQGKPPVDPAFWQGQAAEVVLNRSLAERLQVKIGDEVNFRLAKASDLPAESLLGRRDAKSLFSEVTLKVKAIIDRDQPLANFALQPSTETPRNAFVPLRALQTLLEQPGKINAILAARPASDLNEQFAKLLTLDDFGLLVKDPVSRTEAVFARLDRNRDGKLTGREWFDRIGQRRKYKIAGIIGETVKLRDPERNSMERSELEAYYREHHPYLALESRQVLLEPWVSGAALDAAAEVKLRTAPTLVYLANRISSETSEKSIPYSVVAALDPTLKPPLGPFLPPGVDKLTDEQIILVNWKGNPMPTSPGSRISLHYYPPEEQGQYKEHIDGLVQVGPLLDLAGAAVDPDLTPEFPGLTDATDIGSWDPPFDRDKIAKLIKPGDVNDLYWEEFRTTPKAYVTLKRGQELWGSRFGNLTSIRLAPLNGKDLDAAKQYFETALLKQLTPEKAGLIFEPIKLQAMQASTGSNDFAVLFLAFSFFLIVAALLLVALLYRLEIDRRASQVGLLLATGYPMKMVHRLLLAEGALLAGVGALLGCLVAMVYARLLLLLLAWFWPGGGLGSFLQADFSGSLPSFMVGFGGSLLVSVLTLGWSLRGLGRVPARALLTGQTSEENQPGPAKPPRWSWWTAILAGIGALVLLFVAGKVQGSEAKSGTFFGSGALLLTALLALLSAWMRSSRHRSITGRGWGSVGWLGIRNAARHPGRSLLTAGLLAAAAFLIVAVDAFRRSAEPSSSEEKSASGGFPFVAETDLPVVLDLNSDAGRNEIRDRLVGAYGRDMAAEKRADADMALIQKTTILSFRVKAGDDTSCLNLYQPRKPRLLGVPGLASVKSEFPRGGFLFTGTTAATEHERLFPWEILTRPEGEAIPVFGENNSVIWALKKSLGSYLIVQAGDGTDRDLHIDGLLRDSVFQSSLLMSEANFLKLYPGHSGYNFFLIKPPVGAEVQVREILETALADRGIEITEAIKRLEAYLAVENTYLSTFQALGLLGLLLGSLGLAVVLLRSVWERRAELALLRALGYRRAMLGWLVLAENGFLLLVGLTCGTVSALLAVLPHLSETGGSASWPHLLALLGVVLLVGLTTAFLAVASTLRAPLIPALRKE